MSKNNDRHSSFVIQLESQEFQIYNTVTSGYNAVLQSFSRDFPIMIFRKLKCPMIGNPPDSHPINACNIVTVLKGLEQALHVYRIAASHVSLLISKKLFRPVKPLAGYSIQIFASDDADPDSNK